MPELQANGATLHYEATGSGTQTILFLHGLFLDGQVWRRQVASLASRYRCVTLDFRGQGRSPATPGGYDTATLATDVAAVVERLAAPVHLVGLSLGGFVALQLAIRQPGLVRSLTLLATSAEAEPAEHMFRYRLIRTLGRTAGFRPMAARIMGMLFGPTFLRDPARATERRTWFTRVGAVNRVGTARAIDGMLSRQGLTEQVVRVRCPTLVVVGDEDAVTRPLRSQRLQQGIAGSRLSVIPAAGHTAPVEQPDAVTQALRDFVGAPTDYAGAPA